MKTYKSKLSSIALLLACCFTPVAARAQSNSELKGDVVEALKNANQKIEFYGQVVDQRGAPIGGVLISTTLLSLKDPTGKGDDFEQQQDELTFKTDGAGRFQVTGKTGSAVIIDSLSKEGYIPGALERVQFNFDAEDGGPVHKAAPAKPVVFKMWQRQGKSELIVWDSQNRKIPKDGTPVVLDLIGRDILSGTNPRNGLRLRLDLDESGKTSAADKFPWKVTIEAISGGILPTNDQFMYLAPQTGYTSTYTLTVPFTDSDWSNTRTIKCYYTANEGKVFGRVELEITAPRIASYGIVAVKSAVNVNGSTNLEP